MTNREQSDAMDRAHKLASSIEQRHYDALQLGDRRRLPKLAAVATIARDEAAPLLRQLADELQRVRVEASAARAELARVTHPANRGRPSYDDGFGFDEADFF